MIKTTIITLTYNRLDKLPRTVNSIVPSVAWDGSREYLVVNNASYPDDQEKRETLADYFSVIERDNPFIKTFNAAENLYPHGKNVGIREAQGRYIVMVDDDVIVKRGWLDTLERYLDTHEHVGAAGPCGMFFFPNWSNYTNGWAKVGYTCDVVMGYCWIFRNLGIGFSEDMWEGAPMFKHHDETDLQCAIRAKGFRIARSEDVAIHLHGEGSLSCGDPSKIDWRRHDRAIDEIRKKWYETLKDNTLCGAERSCHVGEAI